MTIRGSNGYFGRAKFKGYLQDLPPNEIVGQRRVFNACPLAVFLNHLIPERDFFSLSVTDAYIDYAIHGVTHQHKTPHWARQLVDTLDAKGTDIEVTAAEALAALD